MKQIFGEIYVCPNPQCEAFNRSRFRVWMREIHRCPYCGSLLKKVKTK